MSPDINLSVCAFVRVTSYVSREQKKKQSNICGEIENVETLGNAWCQNSESVSSVFCHSPSLLLLRPVRKCILYCKCVELGSSRTEIV